MIMVMCSVYVIMYLFRIVVSQCIQHVQCIKASATNSIQVHVPFLLLCFRVV